MDEGQVLYRQFGRMFVQQDKAPMLEELEVSCKKSQKEVKTVDDTITYFEKQRSDAESNLRDMMTQLESQMSKGSEKDE